MIAELRYTSRFFRSLLEPVARDRSQIPDRLNKFNRFLWDLWDCRSGGAGSINIRRIYFEIPLTKFRSPRAPIQNLYVRDNGVPALHSSINTAIALEIDLIK